MAVVLAPGRPAWAVRKQRAATAEAGNEAPTVFSVAVSWASSLRHQVKPSHLRHTLDCHMCGIRRHFQLIGALGALACQVCQIVSGAGADFGVVFSFRQVQRV